MPNIDIEVKADLKELFGIPPCEELRLPSPSPIKIQLPTGGSIKAIGDASKAIPTDCSNVFSLMVQLAPLLASMECLLKILKLLKPLIDVITNLPMPPVKAVQEFAKAAADLAPCLLIPTPANMIPFVRDILCLILKALKCLLAQLRTVLEVMKGLNLQLDAARAVGDSELVNTLECAQKNAQTSSEHLMKSMEPIGVILDLVGPAMGIAGVQPIQLPQIGSSSDLESLNQVVQTLQALVGTIQIVVDTLGGCP